MGVRLMARYNFYELPGSAAPTDWTDVKAQSFVRSLNKHLLILDLMSRQGTGTTHLLCLAPRERLLLISASAPCSLVDFKRRISKRLLDYL